MSSSIRYYKGKAYFAINLKSTSLHGEKVEQISRSIMARSACIVLRYVDESGSKHVLTINGKNNTVEFPGGKVEDGDINIFDTGFREMWEEIFLKDILGNEARYLRDWNNIRKDIMKSSEPDQIICAGLYNALMNCRMIPYGGGALRNIYFLVDITLDKANYLINNHGLIPLGIGVINHVVSWNNLKGFSNGYHRRTTHFMFSGEVYKIRGRDFQGMFSFAKAL
jgi:hypothetical protein